MIRLLFVSSASCKIISEFYTSTRSLMKNDVWCLALLGISSFFVLFFSRKSIYLSTLPLIGLMIKFITKIAIREINLILPDLKGITAILALNTIAILKYSNKDAIRFLISSLISAYILIEICNIIVFLLPTISLIFLYDFYISKISENDNFQIILVNILLCLLGLAIYLTIKKIQKVSLSLLCCFYSSVLLLNSVEIYFHFDLGMKDLLLTASFFEKGIILVYIMTSIGFISQYPLIQKETNNLEAQVKDLELENRIIKEKLERLHVDAKIKNMHKKEEDFHEKIIDLSLQNENKV